MCFPRYTVYRCGHKFQTNFTFCTDGLSRSSFGGCGFLQFLYIPDFWHFCVNCNIATLYDIYTPLSARPPWQASLNVYNYHSWSWEYWRYQESTGNIMHTGYPSSAGAYVNAEPHPNRDFLSLSNWRSTTTIPPVAEMHIYSSLTPPNSRRSTISNPLIDNVQQYLGRRSEQQSIVLNPLAPDFVSHDTDTCARHDLPAAHLLTPIPEALDD